MHRLGFGGGCAAEWMRQSTTVTFLSGHTDGTDPVAWCPLSFAGSIPTIIAPMPTGTAATFTRTAAKNTAPGSNSLLTGSFSAGTPAQGMLVQNTTHPSFAWIYKPAGGANWTISQPMAALAPPSSTVPPEVDTWATNDSVQLISPIPVNVVIFSPLDIDSNAGFDNVGYLQDLTVFDPAGTSNDSVFIGNVYASQVAFQRLYATYPYPSGDMASILSNSVTLGGLQENGGALIIWGGYGLFTWGTLNGYASFQVDGDFILGVSGGITTLDPAAFGQIYLDANLTIAGGTFVNRNMFLATHRLYGNASATLTLTLAARAYQVGATFADAWTAPTLITPGVVMDGASSASCATGTDPAIIHAASTTVAHLDAPCGAGTGLGGAAYNPAGSSLSVAE